jgi:hypothetical protein
MESWYSSWGRILSYPPICGCQAFGSTFYIGAFVIEPSIKSLLLTFNALSYGNKQGNHNKQAIGDKTIIIKWGNYLLKFMGLNLPIYF